MGNIVREGFGSLVFDSQALGLADTTSQCDGVSYRSCRERDNSHDTFAFAGSRLFQGGRGGYGPWRSEPGFFKVKGEGGGGHSVSTHQSTQSGIGAPCPSTSAQTRQGTATYGTPQARLARLMIDIMDDEDQSMQDEILTPGQQALYDLCKHDLLVSCHAYEEGWDRSKGQQFLVDLKRMENVLHKILAVHGDHPTLPTNVYVIGQALTSRLTNPGNLCYGNSAFRCWSWTGAHAEDQIMAWGRTQEAVRHFLASNEPMSLLDLKQLAPIWQHFQEGLQADVGDFVGHLTSFACSTFFGGKFFHVTKEGRLDEREQIPLNMICPDGPTPICLEEIVNLWAEEEGGQYLYGAPAVLIIHLQRSVLVQGQWTKHSRPLDISTGISIPFSEDGIHVHSATYKIVSMALRKGQDHEARHYVAIHAMDNAYWYADDEAYTVPLPHLSEVHRQEIAQVWLAYDCSGELVPDAVEAMAPSQAKRAKHHSETLHFVFANVTSFGRRVQDWIWTKGEHILMLQETHLGQKKMEEAQQYFNARGWKSHGLPAEPTGRGGATGGFLVLHGTRHLTHAAHAYVKEGNGWQAIGLQRQGVTIFLIQLYLRTG